LIIPVVAELIRQHPGTISLGQGVVSYGPPPEAVAEIQRFLAEPENHKYKPVTGVPELVDAFARKLREENGIRLCGDTHFVVTAGGNMAFMNAVLAIAECLAKADPSNADWQQALNGYVLQHIKQQDNAISGGALL